MRPSWRFALVGAVCGLIILIYFLAGLLNTREGVGALGAIIMGIGVIAWLTLSIPTPEAEPKLKGYMKILFDDLEDQLDTERKSRANGRRGEYQPHRWAQARWGLLESMETQFRASPLSEQQRVLAYLEHKAQRLDSSEDPLRLDDLYRRIHRNLGRIYDQTPKTSLQG